MNKCLSKCLHCGSKEGYYVKTKITGTSPYYYKFDNSEADNSTLHDYLNYKEGKNMYCANCDKVIGKNIK